MAESFLSALKFFTDNANTFSDEEFSRVLIERYDVEPYEVTGENLDGLIGTLQLEKFVDMKETPTGVIMTTNKKGLCYIERIEKRDNTWRSFPCPWCRGYGVVEGWGGGPVDCPECKGGQYFWVHLPSGTIAEYPGGPLHGRMTPEEAEKYR